MTNQYRPDRALAVNVTHVFSSTLVPESVVGWSYDYVEVTPAFPDQVDKVKLGLSDLFTVYKSSSTIVPAINPGGVYPSFTFNRLPAFAGANEYQASETLTWTRGKHTFKFGGQFFHNTKQEIRPPMTRARTTFRLAPTSTTPTTGRPTSWQVRSPSSRRYRRSRTRTRSSTTFSSSPRTPGRSAAT